MKIELMSLEDAADVLALGMPGVRHEDGTTRYFMPCGAEMIEATPGQAFFKVTQ